MGDPRIQSNSASHWLLTLLLKDSSLVSVYQAWPYSGLVENGEMRASWRIVED